MSKLSPVRLAIGFVALVFVLALNSRVARADNVETFSFSGTLANSYAGSDIFTGTFTLDTTKGIITAFDFTTPVVTIDAANGWSASAALYAATSPNANFVNLFFVDNDRDLLVLLFETNFSSFNGNTFFTSTVTYPASQNNSKISCDGGCSNPYYFSLFNSGSATPVSPTPEPSSLLLLATGLLGLAPFIRRFAQS
jgi:hypothetical protein